MDIYITYNGENITGIYSTDIWDYDKIPTPNIKISEDQRNEILKSPLGKRYFVKDGAVIDDPIPSGGSYKRVNNEWVIDTAAITDANKMSARAAIYALDEAQKQSISKIAAGTATDTDKAICANIEAQKEVYRPIVSTGADMTAEQTTQLANLQTALTALKG
jgi:hypothetical protein